MLEQDDPTQQAGPSRLNREVVPTSDDEDFFFISQSSDRYGSSLGSVKSSRQDKQKSWDAGEQGEEEEEDDEAALPTRHSPADRRRSQQLDARGQNESLPIGPGATPGKDVCKDDQPLEPGTPSTRFTPDLGDEGSPPRSQPRDGEPQSTLSSEMAPTSSSVATTIPSHSDMDGMQHLASFNGQPSQPTNAHGDRAVELRAIRGEGLDVFAEDDPSNVTIQPSVRSRSASLQSDATLPFAESPTASQRSHPSTPIHARASISAHASSSRLDVPSTSAAEQRSDAVGGPSIDLDSEDDSNSQAASTQERTWPLENAPSTSLTPPLSPLRMPAPGAAPRPRPRAPPMPQQPPPAEPQSHSHSTVDDETLARAAAAQPPTPPRRQLRTRNAAQLNPYTLEAVRYQRALIRNDWEDAVVSQREWHRQERRRIAEEAAKAQREAQAAQGSEESQSQWLIPSSGPSSQADHEEPSLPSSPAAPSMPQVFVEIPALDETDSLRGHASGSRPRRSSPTPSQSGRLPELSEMLARPSKANKAQSSMHATYKGPRTIARVDADAELVRPQGSEGSRVDEDDATPLPPLTVRRKHPLRALSPSDGETTLDASEQAPPPQDTFIVDSSEDERPPSVVPVPKPRRRSRWSGDGSSSDSTDYERRFRQLKKMMPAGMARKHIRDLRAMRHGKAYHSDGHVSSSSSDAGTSNRTAQRNAERSQRANTADISDNESLQPGQTRKRLRRHDSRDGNNALLLDPDSDSSSSSSASSLSSAASVSFVHSNMAEALEVDERQTRHKEAEEVEETPAPWWSVNRFDSYVPYRERDAIDRMLSRTGGGKPRHKAATRTAKTTSEHRQARLDGFVSSHRHRGNKTNSGRSHLREIDQNQRRHQGATGEKDGQQGQSHPPRRKKKRPKLDPRVGRTTGSGTRGAPVVLRNPPVVRPRARPRLDLEQHDVLFAVNPTKIRQTGWNGDRDNAAEDDDVSDDDEGQWQIMSSVVRDSTPASLPDLRLAVPRNRAGGEPRQPPSLTRVGDMAPSPVRGPQGSPAASSTSTRLLGINAVNDQSPGTPSRTRLDAFPRKAPAFSNAGQTSLPSHAAPDLDGNDNWDDFEGISLDFGMVPLVEGKRFEVTGTPLLARLPDLIALPDRLLGHELIPRTWSGEVLRLEDTVLETDMDPETLAHKLPFFVDNLRLKVSRSLGQSEEAGSSVDERRHVRNLVSDTGAFLGCWMVRQAQGAAEGNTDPASIFRNYRTILERIELLQTSVLSLHDTTHSAKAIREDRKLICLQLAWMRFELCWRAIAICDADVSYALEPDAPTVEGLLACSRTLMALLLHHGLHRCVRNLRKAVEGGYSAANPDNATMDLDQDAATTVSIDEATAMWLSVIHLLGSFEKSRGITDGRLFWTQFESTYQRWDELMPKRVPLLRAESLWYCLFALGSLSQVSPDGTTQAAPSLRDWWPLVAKALVFVKFRSEESKEMAMGWHMLAKRDAYVRVVLQRCCLLVSEWRWTMDGAEVTLARLFDIFNSHKLADLPTETEHDFPAFLRDFDVKKLSTADVMDGEAMQDPSFHLFVRLLARAGQELREHAVEAKEGDRRVSRLFSRMTPVRVMPFTRTDVPTSSQRSVLFNHYTVVMLFLHLVPTSSPQRLRQIQSFLPAFKDADFVSQVTCIRAMMYVAVIFRHHRVDLDPVVKWFGDTITVLRREYEEIDSSTKRYERQQLQQSLQERGVGGAARPDGLRMADIFENAPARQAALRRKEEVARLLVVALRSIQHIVRHSDLQGGASGAEVGDQRLPDQLLLSPAWTQQMLEAQIALEPRVGQEVLKCIQTFLLARMRVLQPNAASADTAKPTKGEGQRKNGQQQQPTRDEESQDSFAELFEADDDFDFEDPLLARLLDGADSNTASANAAAERQKEVDKVQAAAAAVAEKKRWDREFGELVKNTISPSLFQLLSNIYHPDRRMEAAATGSVVMSLGVTQRLNEVQIDGHDGAGRVSAARSRMGRLMKEAEARQYVELVVDCWAGCAHVLVTNGLREWSSYLGFGNESWKRIDDAIGRRDVAQRFLQNVVSLDATVLQKREYEVEFLAVWIQTAVARVLSVQDVYTRSMMEAATDSGGRNPSSLLSSIVAQWQTILASTAVDEVDSVAAQSRPGTLGLDLDTFTQHRPALLKATYATLASALANTTASMGTAYSILSALLSSLRAYVEDTPVDSGGASSNHAIVQEYLSFCKTTLSDVESSLAGTSVMTSLKSEHNTAVQLVNGRLEALLRK